MRQHALVERCHVGQKLDYHRVFAVVSAEFVGHRNVVAALGGLGPVRRFEVDIAIWQLDAYRHPQRGFELLQAAREVGNNLDIPVGFEAAERCDQHEHRALVVVAGAGNQLQALGAGAFAGAAAKFGTDQPAGRFGCDALVRCADQVEAGVDHVQLREIDDVRGYEVLVKLLVQMLGQRGLPLAGQVALKAGLLRDRPREVRRIRFQSVDDFLDLDGCKYLQRALVMFVRDVPIVDAGVENQDQAEHADRDHRERDLVRKAEPDAAFNAHFSTG